MRHRAGVIALAATLALPGQPLGAQQAEVPELLLVRCTPASSVACLTATLDLQPGPARQLRRVATASTDTGWRVRFRGDTAAPGIGRRTVTERPRPARVLVLVDVSGSMRANLGIGFVKLALKDHLLRVLDSVSRGTALVAVAPFGSIDVRRRVEAARFVSPAQAVEQVEALPPPDRENTGLYSAVVFSVERLERELATAGEGALGLLVVITDGDNDVRPGDDVGLLTGDAGLAEATRRLGGSRVVPWLVGIGNRVSAGPLQRLAGTTGRSTVVPIDALALARPLREVQTVFASAWEVGFRMPRGGREELGRGWALAVFRHPGAGPEVNLPAVWRPPVVALPAFSGVATSDLVLPGLDATPGLLVRRVPLLLFTVVLLAMLWLVMPRLLWPRLPVAGAPAAEPKKKAVGGLRAGVTEAPPRRPQDITAGKARAIT